jgi:hypothetical protein
VANDAYYASVRILRRNMQEFFMKNLLMLVLPGLCLACASFPGTAQQIYPDSIKDVHDSNADQAYSQAQSLTQKLPLDLMAVNEPEQFEGLPVTNMEGVEIGKVISVARRNSDQALHLIISAQDGAPAAVKIDELTVGALAYWDPAGSLHDQHFEEAAFEPVSQYQSGHSAWGSLTHPTVESLQTALDEQRDSADAAATAEQVAVDDAVNGPSSAVPVYEPVGSSIVQLALNRPDAFQQKLLIDDHGQTLGQIAYIARNLQNQELYAVVMDAEGRAHTAVKLDALTVARLTLENPTDGTGASAFDEDEFETVDRK